MSFFDSKQEVLNIELTPYGRNLLARGKFKPEYYSFHDDDVIYDILYASTNGEQQISSSIRILEETPYLKPQARLTNVDKTSIVSAIEDPNADTVFHIFSMGNSSLTSDYKPAWDVKLLNGKLDSFSQTYKKSSLQDLPIPQINLKDIIFYLKSKTQNEEKGSLDFIFPDGTAVSLEKDFILLDIVEKNVDNKKQNFELEIFEVETVNSKDVLKRLQFEAEQKFIVDNILLDKPEFALTPIEREKKQLILADNYFGILLDEEIDLEMLNAPPQETVSTIREAITKPPFGEDC